jgi:hypothetical protein
MYEYSFLKINVNVRDNMYISKLLKRGKNATSVTATYGCLLLDWCAATFSLETVLLDLEEYDDASQLLEWQQPLV